MVAPRNLFDGCPRIPHPKGTLMAGVAEETAHETRVGRDLFMGRFRLPASSLSRPGKDGPCNATRPMSQSPAYRGSGNDRTAIFDKRLQDVLPFILTDLLFTLGLFTRCGGGADEHGSERAPVHGDGKGFLVCRKRRLNRFSAGSIGEPSCQSVKRVKIFDMQRHRLIRICRCFDQAPADIRPSSECNSSGTDQTEASLQGAPNGIDLPMATAICSQNDGEASAARDELIVVEGAVRDASREPVDRIACSAMLGNVENTVIDGDERGRV